MVNMKMNLQNGTFFSRKHKIYIGYGIEALAHELCICNNPEEKDLTLDNKKVRYDYYLFSIYDRTTSVENEIHLSEKELIKRI